MPYHGIERLLSAGHTHSHPLLLKKPYTHSFWSSPQTGLR
jgi:hypothetical protein